MNSPGWQVFNMLLEISGEITPERMKEWRQNKNNTQLQMGLMIEASLMLQRAILHRNLECQVHQFSSVQFSCSVMSDSLRPHESQQTRPPCPSPTPGVHPNPCPLSCEAIQPSHPVIPFSSCPQSFPASGSFQMNQLFASGGQSIGVSASTSVLPMNTWD